jgi:SNF2 family DNA or RNA helicase
MSKIIELFSNHSTTDKSMIICHYQEEMDLINNYLSKAFPNLNIRQFNGSMSLNQRNDCITSCMRGDVDVLLIQILCGGVGLNLQVFNKVYINTPDWNPSNEIQAIARCHRIGQQQNVDVYKLIIIDPEISSIDGNILNIQHNKRKLMAEYLSDQSLEFNGTYQYNSGLTANDFRRLLL